MKSILRTLCAVALITSAFASAALAQDAYPSKAIKLIVPLGAGGATDVVARVVVYQGTGRQQPVDLAFVDAAVLDGTHGRLVRLAPTGK